MKLLIKALQDVAKKIGSGQTSPVPELIFEPFRYGGPENQDVIIFGQDPYPDPTDAQGICFSSPRKKRTPASLKNIFRCLQRAGLMAGPECNDLRSWVAQGVCMLNSALTTQAGARGGHLTIWKAFMTDLVVKYCSIRAKITPAHFLLWGDKAAVFAEEGRRFGHIIHMWSHPSPIGDNSRPTNKRFIHCPHFEEVNQARVSLGRAPIVWDTSASAIGFTDGGCLSNGKAEARASFAVFMAGAAFENTTIQGLVEPREYKFVDDTAPELGIVAMPDTVVAPTNNRGEWLAIIYCFLAALRARVTGEFELCSDSMNSVMTLTEWYANRVQKGTENEMKNQDLLLIALKLHGLLKFQVGKIYLTHFRSHQKKPPPAASARERYLWAGNRRVDTMATNELAQSVGYAVAVHSPLASVRRLATSEILC